MNLQGFVFGDAGTALDGVGVALEKGPDSVLFCFENIMILSATEYLPNASLSESEGYTA